MLLLLLLLQTTAAAVMVKCVISFDVGIPKFYVVFFFWFSPFFKKDVEIYIYVTLCESKCEAASKLNKQSKSVEREMERRNYKTRSELFFVVCCCFD